ncbi:MAG TPA: tetratricopeptide repeat protein [Bryobacteraceae bacterium]|nr:tetratricopeptide repeat protein [Bryobacteraceae bacterium]
MKFHRLALSAIALLALSFPLLAQITAIEGVVKGADGKPVQGAKIKIVRTDIKGNYDTKTDKKGHYIYMGLPMGKYDVNVEMDGKMVDQQKGVATHPGDPIPVSFDLKADNQQNASKQAEMQKAVETGQISDDLKRQMTPEQKAALEKSIKDQAEKMKGRKELNDAFNAGMDAAKVGDWPKAVESFTKASTLDPTQVAVWSQLAEANVKLAGTKTGPDADAAMQEGLKDYQKSIELKPDDPASHNNYALALAKAKKFPEAQAELQKAAQLDPTNGGKYYYNLGALEVNSGQNEAAADAFKKAYELTPTYADAYYQYGVMLVSKAQIGADGKVTPAPGTIEAFQKYLELAPTGQFAQQAKDMLTTLGSSVNTKYANPDAKKKKK